MIIRVKREIWIDYVKVFLIYLMIVAHSGQIPSIVDNYICSFHMPAFLVISGLLYKPSDNIIQSVKKNVKRLLVPTLFFSVLCALYNNVMLLRHGALNVDNGFIQPLFGLFFYDRKIGYPACGVIWFVVVLFMSKITLDVLCKYCKQYMILLFVLIVAFFASLIRKGDFTYFYYLERWMACLPLVYVGYIMKKYQILQRLTDLKCKYLLIGGGICAHVFLFQLNGRVGIHSFVFGYSLWIFYFIAMIEIFSLFLLAKITLNNHGNNLIVWLSKNTLTILCLHKVVLSLTTRFIHEGFIQSFFTLLCLIPVIWLFDKYCPLLIGNKKIKFNEQYK